MNTVSVEILKDLYYMGVNDRDTNLFENMWPLQRIRTSFALMTVPTPTVRASEGTSSGLPPKKRALAILVSVVSVLIRVRLERLEPGSLNAICPSGPIPPMNKSMPPASLIICS